MTPGARRPPSAPCGSSRIPPLPARRLAAGAVGALALLTAVPLAAPVGAAGPWWQLAGLAGQRVTRVAVVSGHVVAVAGGVAMTQTASGFVPGPPPPVEPPGVTVAGITWSISSAGEVLVARGGGAPARDPGSPALGAGAHLLAAPLVAPSGGTPGSVVLAVSASGVVWRRAPDGTWAVSLVLLPSTLVTGTPAVTSIAAFSQSRQSGVVYLGTEGYGTLLTSDGGDDWIRADPGLPSDVLSLAADPGGSGSIWAGTSSGLYVHRLQPLPGVPSYSRPSLVGKWLITAGVGGLAVLLAAAALIAWSRRPRLAT